MLARLLATLTNFWIDSTGDFIERLAADWSAIQQTFHEGRELQRVVSVETNLSDPAS